MKTLTVSLLTTLSLLSSNTFAQEYGCRVSLQGASKQQIRALKGQQVNGYTIVKKNSDLVLSIGENQVINEEDPIPCEERYEGAGYYNKRLGGRGHGFTYPRFGTVVTASGFKYKSKEFCPGNPTSYVITHESNKKTAAAMKEASSRAEYDSLQAQIDPSLDTVVPAAKPSFIKALELLPPCGQL